MIDIERLRADTPGVGHVTHFNNAGAALMPDPVLNAVRGYFDEEATRGGYETHRKRGGQIEAVYESLAGLMGAKRSEVAIADNATRAWDLLFYAMRLGEGDRIITTSSEYVSNWAAYLHVRNTNGVAVDIVPDTPEGDLDVAALETMVKSADTALITMNHMPTNGGLLNPAADVGDVASRHGVPYLLDVCQSIGQVPLDVNTIKCDMATGTSRKYLRGPRGVGFLFVTDAMAATLDPVFVETENAPVVFPDSYDLASGAHRFETWEKSYANVAGFGTAIDYAMDIGVEEMWSRIQMLAATLREYLSSIDGVTVHDRGVTQGGIVTFDIDGRQTVAVRELLAERSINVSVVSPSSAPFDMRARDLEGLVRASVHAYNTDDEIDELVEAVQILA